MATLILSSMGTAIGGPIGGAVGALVGRAVDGSVIGRPTREGPRLAELAVTMSSYGQPIPAVFGTMRLPGTIVWSTDLVESSETSGGKGRPRTTSYSYSISIAVALSSRPVERVGRIWADGALLRGSAGDLKVGGSLRLHRGIEDQPPDPLIAADRGTEASALRGIAYLVLEDLDLASFGNRLPALSFEVFAGPDGAIRLQDLLGDPVSDAGVPVPLTGLAGFADSGGSRSALLGHLGQVWPHVVTATRGGLAFGPATGEAVVNLPPPVTGRPDGTEPARPTLARSGADATGPAQLRYYDPARDYQISMQRAPGTGGGHGTTIEVAGCFAAADAQRRIAAIRRCVTVARERLTWRLATSDPALPAGAFVSVPDRPGSWLIRAWEWHADGIDLSLERTARTPDLSGPGMASHASAGVALGAPDDIAGELTLRYFELPWDGSGAGNAPQRFIAATRSGARTGLPLLGIEREALVPLGMAARGDARQGETTRRLGPSAALLLEPDAAIEIALAGQAMLQSVSPEALLGGANRLRVGEEILQFLRATPLSPNIWRLEGLLRGRGGTEHHALAGHPIGTPAILLDERLVVTEARMDALTDGGIAALPDNGAEPVPAALESAGETLRPLAPVHPRFAPTPNGDPEWRWIRRARGAWAWPAGTEVPLAEEREAYRIGLGPTQAPVALWETRGPHFTLPRTEWAELTSQHPDAGLWVSQIGSHAVSLPTRLPLDPPTGVSR